MPLAKTFFLEKWVNFGRFVETEIVPLLERNEGLCWMVPRLRDTCEMSGGSVYQLAQLIFMQEERIDWLHQRDEHKLATFMDPEAFSAYLDVRELLPAAVMDKLWRYAECFAVTASKDYLN